MKRPRFWRTVEFFVRPFETEQREWIVRMRLWRMKWFPYRLIELVDVDENGHPTLGKTTWHQPRALKKFLAR